MIREAWFCPACQKYHAPHCDTCPGTEGVKIADGAHIKQPIVLPLHPYVAPWRQPYPGDDGGTPWTPLYWHTTCVSPVALAGPWGAHMTAARTH